MIDGLGSNCGDFLISCFEEGLLSFDEAHDLILAYDPIWEVELIAAESNIEWADTH